MTRVLWTRQAVEDVEAIKNYVARDSKHYATLLAERLVAAVSRLKTFPQSGRVVPKVADEAVRESFAGATAWCRLHADVVEIVTVYHAARLLRVWGW